MDGLLVIDKPVGPTSHDVVARVRRILGERSVGHTGTLDPMASGVLPLVVGRATRLARFISDGRKTYLATVRLGLATDTYDALGQPDSTPFTGPWPTRDIVEHTLTLFRGTFSQRPPAFSAKKVDGYRSHRLARARQRQQAALAALAVTDPVEHDGARPPDDAVVPAPVLVTTDRLELLSIDRNEVTLSIVCSAGFYVRSLAHDLGRALGIGAHLAALRRTDASGLTLADAVPLGELEDPTDGRARAQRALAPLASLLPDLPRITLNDEGVLRTSRGADISERHVAGGELPAWTPGSPSRYCRLFSPGGNLLAIAEPSTTAGLLHPAVVLM